MTDVLDLADSLIRVGIRAEFEVSQFGEVFGYPLLGMRRPSLPGSPRIYLSSGIHGDEPAGVHALKSIVSSDLIPRSFDLTICPLLNPSGLQAGTRENRDGIDLNRDFTAFRAKETQFLRNWLKSCPQFDLSINLHEDWEATGFYLYYLDTSSASNIAERVRNAVAKAGRIDPATEIDGRPARHGIIRPPAGDPRTAMRDWPEAIYLFHRNPHPHLTIETCSTDPLENRIPLHMAAVAEAVRSLSSIAKANERK